MSAASPSSALRTRLLYLAVSLAVLVLDQSTKKVVSSRMELHDTIPVVEGYFHITYVRNPGAAFGIFSGRDSLPKHVAFYATSVLAFGVLIYNVVASPIGQRWLHFGLHLALGGAIGNLVDRVRFGFVVDFLDVHYQDWVWPTFNVADSCICVGIGIMAWQIFRADAAAAPAGPKPEAVIAMTEPAPTVAAIEEGRA